MNDKTATYTSKNEQFDRWMTDEPVKPPCTSACPVNTDVQGFVTLVAQGRFKESLDVVRDRCTLVASLGRICHHPCEGECRRNEVEGAVNIRGIKRFAADACMNEPHNGPVPKTRGKRIAIIGGGPAGLAAAYDLAHDGFDVTIYEKESACGGAIYYGVPKYRLPKDVLAWDVAAIEALGVTIKTSTEVGKDVLFDDLAKEYDAVLVAIGLTLSRGLPIPGNDTEGVLLALPFLREANFNDNAIVGKRVVVIGGGNVAFDVARSALRLGAEEVNLTCLECDAEIPAHRWEVDEALEEGVKVNPSWGPVAITAENGKVTGIQFKRCTRVFDENRIFNPAYDECELLDIQCDNVIFAIGQGSDMSGFAGSSLEVNERGRITWDPQTYRTNLENVFACGEVITGPGSAVNAMKTGHDAATAIECYLTTGKTEPLGIKQPVAIGRLPEAAAELIKPRVKNELPMLKPEIRVQSFIEAEATLTEKMAMYEAARCMNCSRGAVLVPDKCVSCLTCVRVCPYGAPYIGDRLADFDWDICQSCGICAAECPQLAIDVIYNDDTLINEFIDRGQDGITVFACQYTFPSVKNPASRATADSAGLNIVRLMCTSRLDTKHILRAIENGADGAAVIACPDEVCRHRKETNWAEVRTNRVKRVLDEAGVNGERVQYIGYAVNAADFDSLVAEFKEKLAEIGPNPVKKEPVGSL